MKRAASAPLFLLLLITACTSSKQSSANRSEVKNEATPATQTTAQGDLQVGQARGSCTARGETVELKYAYAGRAQRFGNESMVILLTDKPIPAEAVAEEIRSQTLLQKGDIRGLEYAIDNDGTWVRFHPSQYQESSNKQLKEYNVEGDVVRGLDDGSANLSDQYNRNVKFVAAIVK
jgi:hypothetical protein